MTRIIRIDVLPDIAGHWSVTRDRVVDGEFNDRDRAVAYAETCVARAQRAGVPVQLEVHAPIEG